MRKKYTSLGYENCIFDFKDKEKNVNTHIMYMLNRLHKMFEYDGLPDTIPHRVLELYLQTNGNVCFYKHNDKLYAFTGSMGGVPDAYYMPSEYIIANPALNLSVSAKIDIDCVVIPNDTMYIGLIPLLSRYCTELAENELSKQIAVVNTRILSLISAKDDRTKESAIEYIRKIEKGENGVIAENAFLDGIKVQPYGATGNTNYITNLIENEQYIKASMFNELGLNANYNMKRESINSGESQLNNDLLLPLIDDMLECRERGLEKVNAMFGTNIKVKKSSAWEDNQQELDAEHDILNNEIDTEKGENDDEKTIE